MRLDPYVNTHPRLLRKAATDPVAGGQPEAGAPAKGTPKGKATDSRFVGATHLDEKQKLDIERALKQRRIGDDMGRQIFIAVVEYQLSAFADQLMRSDGPNVETVPRPRDRALEQILLAVEEQARLLSELLLQVPRPSMPELARVLTAQDERGRAYDEGYLCELGGEIDRLRRACNAMTTTEETQETGPDPETSVGFVSKLAGIFAECFEQEPTAAEDGPFRACLEVLDEMTDYVIGHEPGFLSRILDNR